MKLKLRRISTFIEKFGLWKGVQLYAGLRRNNLSQVLMPGIRFPFYLRPGTTDNAIFDQVFLHEEYSFPFPFKPSVIVDAGAHIGLFTIFIKNIFPEASIICMEPGKENFKQLQKNIQPYQNIQTLHAALWNSTAQIRMNDPFQLGQSGLVANEDPTGETEAVSMQTLMERFSITHIDILKLDIETAEKMVFASGHQDWLPRVRLIIIELHDWLEPGCARIFFEAVHHSFKNYRYQVFGENTIIENLDFRF